MARKSEYNAKLHCAFGKHLASTGLTDVQISEAMGISEKTLNNWKNKYPAFKKALIDGKEEPDNQVEVSLFKRATGYSHEAVKILVCDKEVQEVPYMEHWPPDPTSMIFWLKNRRPDRWRDKQDVEHSGKVEINFAKELQDV